MNPWIIVGFLIALGAAATGGFFYGEHVEGLACTVQADKARAVGQEIKDKEAAKGADQSGKVEGQHAQDKIVYRNITTEVEKIVDRPVYRAQCFDPDGLRDANAALTRARPDSRQPDGLVPTAPTAR